MKLSCILGVHRWSLWADLGDYLNQSFRKCEDCGKTQISKSSR
jgi:hypothetical protein